MWPSSRGWEPRPDRMPSICSGQFGMHSTEPVRKSGKVEYALRSFRAITPKLRKLPRSDVRSDYVGRRRRGFSACRQGTPAQPTRAWDRTGQVDARSAWHGCRMFDLPIGIREDEEAFQGLHCRAVYPPGISEQSAANLAHECITLKTFPFLPDLPPTIYPRRRDAARASNTPADPFRRRWPRKAKFPGFARRRWTRTRGRARQGH